MKRPALVILALLAASLSYAGEPKITVGDCHPKKSPAIMSIWHHPHPPVVITPLFPGVWPFVAPWGWFGR